VRPQLPFARAMSRKARRHTFRPADPRPWHSSHTHGRRVGTVDSETSSVRTRGTDSNSAQDGAGLCRQFGGPPTHPFTESFRLISDASERGDHLRIEFATLARQLQSHPIPGAIERMPEAGETEVKTAIRNGPATRNGIRCEATPSMLHRILLSAHPLQGAGPHHRAGGASWRPVNRIGIGGATHQRNRRDWRTK